MEQSGNARQLRNVGIGCMFLIVISQIVPFAAVDSPLQLLHREATKESAYVNAEGSPLAVHDAAIAYDAESDRIVLFGGELDHSVGYIQTDQTWAYDYNTNTWTNMNPPVSPEARYNHKMVYDSESDLIIMYGGQHAFDGELVISDATWIYDLNSNTWTRVFPDPSPGPQYDHAMTYDSQADLVILISGEQRETWTFDVNSNTWTNVTSEYTPPCNFQSIMVYDDNEGVSVLQVPFYSMPETSVFDSAVNSWTTLWPTCDSPCNSDYLPAFGSSFSMTYNSNADRAILFGDGHTWTYSYAANTWYEMCPQVSPPAREGADMAYDSESDITILFGGQVGVADTWAYSYGHNNWTEMSTLLDVDNDGTFCFVAYGETRGDSGMAVSPIHSSIVSHYIQHNPEFVIHTGDMVYTGSDPGQWAAFNNSISLLNELEIPIYGTPGRHDNLVDFRRLPGSYEDFFNYSDVIDQSGETELYYSFDMNGIHFISISTLDEWEIDGYRCPAAQMEWLETDLAGEHEFIIVFFNQPAWSVGEDSPLTRGRAEWLRDVYHPIFVEHGVDIVFNGCDRLYYRTIRDGIHYVVTGGGGAPLSGIQTEDTVWQMGDVGFSDHHYCAAKTANGILNVDVFLLNGTIADSFDVYIIPPDQAAFIVVSSATVVATTIVVILAIWKKEEI